MATPTASPIRRPPVDDCPVGYTIPVIFLSAVVKDREVFWSHADRPAREAFFLADDSCGLRWWKGRPGEQAATLEMLREFWPEDIAAGLSEKARFVKAVKESALGCLR